MKRIVWFVLLLISSGGAWAKQGAPLFGYQLIEVESVESLEQLFEQAEFSWPLKLGEQAPPILIKSFPEDFSDVEAVNRKKSLFLRALLPVAIAENRRLAEQRKLLKLVLSGSPVQRDSLLGKWLYKLAERHGVSKPYEEKARLLRRLDVIPHGLVLAQAAIETGWGSSRFLHEGNSLFGQWTWSGEGIVPEGREEGKTHRVKSFSALHLSVRGYLNNLNTSNAYSELRRLREAMRRGGEVLDPLKLATGLSKYSQRGEAYVEELHTILESNNLVSLGAR